MFGTCRVRAARIAAVIGIAAGCRVGDLVYEDRYCDVAYPCADGYHCVQNKCVKDAGPVDGPLKPHDGSPDGKDLPGTDLFTIDGADAQVGDLMPVPDGGCPPGYSSCGGVCVDTQTDFYHCSGCNKPCPKGATDRCEGGNCHCGATGPMCDNDLNCYKGACTCLVGFGSLCQGCCKSGVCEPGTEPAACGTGSVSCSVCPIAVCRQSTCTQGQCGQNNVPNGTNCSLPGLPGVCYSGGCCTGCWDGNSCESGTSILVCGKYGAPCKSCNPITPNCISGLCQ